MIMGWNGMSGECYLERVVRAEKKPMEGTEIELRPEGLEVNYA